jgi:hypothetical protein
MVPVAMFTRPKYDILSQVLIAGTRTELFLVRYNAILSDKVNQRFERRYRLHFQNLRVS